MGKLNGRNTGTGNVTAAEKFMRMLNESLSDDPHLTDAELIGLGAGLVDSEDESRLRAHTQRCAHCAAELATFAAPMAAWGDPAAIERLEARINRPAILSGGSGSAEPWWSRGFGWVPLAGLRPKLGAFAASIDEATIDLPIYEGDSVVTGLTGIVQRREQEYYVRITTSPEFGDSQDGRQVEVIAAEPTTGRILLQRKVDLDQYVLLGTDLPLDSNSITARLI